MEFKIGDHVEVRNAYNHCATNPKSWSNGYKVIEVHEDYLILERIEGHFRGVKIHFFRDAVRLKDQTNAVVQA